MNYANAYQATTLQTAVYPGAGTGSREALIYCALGLAGETGEAVEVIKKLQRGDFGTENPGPAVDGDHIRPFRGTLDTEFKRRLRSELGDIAWYLFRLADELGVPMSDILADNLQKLEDRHERDVVRGSGNDR